MKLITKNRRAFYEYKIGERMEAGIVLLGHEVKQIKNGRITLKGSFVTIREGEAYLLNAHIPPYPHGTSTGYDPYRTRKLLLKKREILDLTRLKEGKGRTVVPIAIYIKKGKVKVEIGVGEGKKAYDKRESIKKRETERELGSAVRGKR